MAQFLKFKAVFLLSVITVLAQSQNAVEPSIQDLIASVKGGEFSVSTLNKLARARATDAIPALEQQFGKTMDPSKKESIASVLIRLGDKDQRFWDVVESSARQAIDSDAPFPMSFNSQGRVIARQLSNAFIMWAREHNLSPDTAASDWTYTFPGYVTYLAITGDPRGRDLLRRGMQSPNYFIQAACAKGLAKLRDESSVALIINACEKAPPDAADLIARALVFFNDEQASVAARRFITNPAIFQELRRLRQKEGIDALF